ncbi:hypothetical protein niasHT_001126 [Heterodera trifolii]|uniref:IMD domain-containing protein n=1 Tax=Heterodera trifolii TaxID=157864 RepID=A0ABD2LYZ4_9BILA
MPFSPIWASNSAWDTFGGRAAKLSSQLHQMAAAFGAFVDALQTISDSANTVNGVSRDIGAALTRFCLRQRAVETAIRKWGETLQKHCADGLGRRGGEWRQTISDLERRHQRNCKRFKTSGGGKHNKNGQQIEAENRNFYIELLHAQRSQCTEFVVGTLLPVINAQMVLLDEGAHIQPILDSIEKSVNENDTARLIHTLLEDIDNGRENGEQRIGMAMAQSRAKSASQARLFGVGSDRTDGDEHFSAAEPCHSLNFDGSSAASLLLMANRNSMPPPSAGNSHYFFSSCPSSAVATLSSSSSSSPFVAGGAAAADGGSATTEDIWQQNVLLPRTAPSPHHRLPLPQPFVRSQMVATINQNSAVSPPPPSSTHCDNISPPTQNQCQKPPVPPNNWNRTNYVVSHQQNTRPIGPFPSQQNILERKATEGEVNSSSSVHSRAMATKMSIINSIPSATDQNGTQLAFSSALPPPPAQHADSTDSGSHCSSALMAETLQQIDQLGLELNSYCDGLDEINNGNAGERHRFALPPPHSLPPFVTDSVPSAVVRFRSCATAVPQFQNAVSLPPPPPPPPPPLPPQRRNSAISSATPSAPSIAQLRSIGASAAPFGASPLTLAPLPKNAVVSAASVVVPPSPSPMPFPPHHPPLNR